MSASTVKCAGFSMMWFHSSIFSVLLALAFSCSQVWGQIAESPSISVARPLETFPAGFRTKVGVADAMARSLQLEAPLTDGTDWATTRSADEPASASNGSTVSEILKEIRREATEPNAIPTPWWQAETSKPISDSSRVIPTSVDDLIQLGLMNAAKLKIANFIPQIRQTAVTEADSEFDWNGFASSMWRDTSDPVGSSLTIGGLGGNRFREHDLDFDYGARRKNRRGGNLELLQQWGYQDNNSSFFIPNDQATTRFVLRYTQPLLRGRGEEYNQSLLVLASIDVKSAQSEYMRQLQGHLLEISRSYWALYLERVNLAQRIRLFLKTRDVEESLRIRQRVDAGKAQLARAQAALESRKSDLIRSQAAIKNAETRLRALINAPELGGSPEATEFIPTDHPIIHIVEHDLESEFQTALHNRPEVRAAMNSIQASCVRLNMARHEIMPVLNLLTESYVAGLRGNTDFGNAWVDQFRTGEPSYSVGFEFEIPRGRRAAKARLTRRQLERAQIQEEYRNVLELTRAEVEIAVRELHTAHQELKAKYRSLEAARFEVETIEFRWKNLAEQGSAGGLMLDSLLRAQERVTENEYEFAKAQLTYNLSIINLRHANGTLFQTFPNEIYTQAIDSSIPSSLSSRPPQGVVEWGARSSQESVPQ